MSKRLVISLITGALLGVVCIVGALLRTNFQASVGFIFALWFNRVVMGLVIGLIVINTSLTKLLLRGAIIGLIISFAFYSANGYIDLMSFLAGILYGIIIEYVLYKFAAK